MDQRSGRFAIIPARALDDPRVENAALRVLCTLGRYSDKGGWCYPSLARVAEEMGVSRQAISKQVSILVLLGYLERRPRTRPDGSNASNLYRIILDTGDPDPLALAADQAEYESYISGEPMPGDVVAPATPRLPLSRNPQVAPSRNPQVAPRTSHSNVPIQNDLIDRSRNLGEHKIDRFAEFWGAYPRKAAKAAALKAWAKLKPADELAAAIVSAVILASGTEQWRRDNGAYIPYPATYLNGRRWEDEPPAHTTEPRRAIPPRWL